jgi:hypothetical protein
VPLSAHEGKLLVRPVRATHGALALLTLLTPLPRGSAERSTNEVGGTKMPEMSTAPLTYDNWLKTKHQLGDFMFAIGSVAEGGFVTNNQTLMQQWYEAWGKASTWTISDADLNAFPLKGGGTQVQGWTLAPGGLARLALLLANLDMKEPPRPWYKLKSTWVAAAVAVAAAGTTGALVGRATKKCRL